MFSQKLKPRQVKIKYQGDVTTKLRVINAFGFLMAFQNSGTLWSILTERHSHNRLLTPANLRHRHSRSPVVQTWRLKGLWSMAVPGNKERPLSCWTAPLLCVQMTFAARPVSSWFVTHDFSPWNLVTLVTLLYWYSTETDSAMARKTPPWIPDLRLNPRHQTHRLDLPFGVPSWMMFRVPQNTIPYRLQTALCFLRCCIYTPGTVENGETKKTQQLPWSRNSTIHFFSSLTKRCGRTRGVHEITRMYFFCAHLHPFSWWIQGVHLYIYQVYFLTWDSTETHWLVPTMSKKDLGSVPSYKPTYPTFGNKDNHLQKGLFGGYMLVSRRVQPGWYTRSYNS